MHQYYCIQYTNPPRRKDQGYRLMEGRTQDPVCQKEEGPTPHQLHHISSTTPAQCVCYGIVFLHQH